MRQYGFCVCSLVGFGFVFFTGRLGGNNRREKEATRKIKSEPKYLREPDSGLRHRVFEISKGGFREVSSDT